MTGRIKVLAASLLLLALVAVLYTTMGAQDDPATVKQRMAELGRQHKTASDLYQALKDQAKHIEFVGRFGDDKVRKIARKLKADMLRAA